MCTVNRKSLEQVIWVAVGAHYRSRFSRWAEFAIGGKSPNVVDVGDVLSSGIPVVDHDHPFPDWADDNVIHEQKHHSIQVEGFGQELLALFDLENVLQGILNKDARLQLLHELLEVRIVKVDG